MRLLTLLLCLILLCGVADASPSRGMGTPVPAAARSAGYLTHTFSANRNFSSATVDTGLTYNTGFQWYFWNFFGHTPNTTGTTFNSDGSVNVFEPGSSGTLVSAGEISGTPNFRGLAFGGGGYFETEAYFNPLTTVAPSYWPAVWMMSLEHLVGDGTGDQWAGQVTGYRHYMEVDTMEFDQGSLGRYGATLHDWYGIYNVTCTAWCVVDSNQRSSNVANVPTATDWTLPHRYGVLWVPATGSTNGSYTFYFDDIPMATQIIYSQFTTQGPPPTVSTTWTWGIGDTQHLVLIIGDTSVRSVNVWQASSSGNVTN